MSEAYRHPITFRPTGDLARDFAPAFEDFDTNVASWLPADRSARILDVGCGWGQFLFWLKQRGYSGGQGIDVGEAQVEHCRGIGLVATRVTDSRAFLLEGRDAFEVVTLHHLIEHMPAPDGLELMRAALGALVPGGRVIVQTPNMSAPSAGFSRYIELTHVTGFTENSLRELLELAAFVEPVVFGSRTPFRLRPSRLVWMGAQAVTRAVWRAMLVAELGTDAPRFLQKNLYATATRGAGSGA